LLPSYYRLLFPKGWLCQADGFNKLLLNTALATLLFVSVKRLIQKIYSLEKIDFVDFILIVWNHISGAKIHSFDKKVNKLCR